MTRLPTGRAALTLLAMVAGCTASFNTGDDPDRRDSAIEPGPVRVADAGTGLATPAPADALPAG